MKTSLTLATFLLFGSVPVLLAQGSRGGAPAPAAGANAPERYEDQVRRALDQAYATVEGAPQPAAPRGTEAPPVRRSTQPQPVAPASIQDAARVPAPTASKTRAPDDPLARAAAMVDQAYRQGGEPVAGGATYVAQAGQAPQAPPAANSNAAPSIAPKQPTPSLRSNAAAVAPAAPPVPAGRTTAVPTRIPAARQTGSAAVPTPPAPGASPAGVPPVAPAVSPAPATGETDGGRLPPGWLNTLPPALRTNAAVLSALAATNGPAADGGDDADGDQVIPAGQIKFEEADLGQVLTIYQDLTGRTVLRPASLPQTTVTIYTQTDLTRREAIQALDSILSLNGIAMVPQGEKFVKALPSGEAPQAAQVFYEADPEDLPEAGQPISYIARIKYADLEDVTSALEQFKSKAGTMVGIKSTQTLVIRDNAENVKRMLEMIREIDVYIPREYTPVVIPIKYALAADIAQVLSSLTAGGGSVTSVGGQGMSSQRFSTPGGGAMPGYTPGGATGSRMGSSSSRYGGGYGGYGGGTSGGYGGYGGSAYPRSAGMTVVPPGGPEELDVVQPQSSFQQRLQQIVNKASEEDIVVLGQTKIIADERTNSLLIFASNEDIEMIKDIVAKLDVVLAQVLIEAVVLEVSLTDSFSFGVSALQHPASSGKWSGVGGFRNEPIPTDPWSWIPGAAGAATGTNSAILPNLPSGLSYFARYNNDLDLAVQAIASMGNVKVLSRPRVQTSHAVPCRIFVGETRPYVTGVGYGGYGGFAQSQIAQLRIGIELNVLPLINPDGLVVMDIDQRVDNVGENVLIDDNQVPTTVERSANAKVSVRDGETVILGGFIRSEKRDANSGVPFLKDIPLLGYLFRSTSRSDQRVELMILIRPKVLPTPEDAAFVAMEEKGKMPGISKAERAFTEEERKGQKRSSRELYEREGF